MIFSLNKLFQFSRCPVRIVNKSFGHKSKAKLFNLLATMPKEKPHIPKMQAERQLKKVTKTKYPPGVVNLQVLGSGARGAPRSLYIFTDQSCYLFNAGEGSQRLAHEHKFKLAKVEHIFFTKTSWDNVGGLPGISLTIQDVGVPHITLHGPPGLGELFDAASRFIILKDLQVNHVDATSPDSFFEDSVMKITYVPIDSSNDLCRSNSSSPCEEEEVTNYYCKEIPHSPGSPAPKRTRIDLSNQRSSKSAISYICRIHPKQGTLLAEKCVEFGVPPGPLYGQLKAGKDITLPDGRVVLAKDVRSPDDPGPAFLVVECPSEAYLGNLIKNSELAKLQAANGANEHDSPQVVVHFTPMELVKHPKYQEWVERFACNTKHMYLGLPEDENHRRGLGSEAVHRIQHKLNLISQDIFPLLSSDMKTEQEPETDDCQTLTTFQLRPLKKLNMDAVPRITSKAYIDEVLEQDGLKACIESLKTTLDNATPLSDKSYPKFIFLGTGSCIPNKTRNTSAILVEIEKDRFMLMDCGEGTYGQIVRFFGLERANQVLSNLVGIYISHLHADHHIGLIGLLQGRERAFEFTKTNPEPTMLIAPQQINYWLKTYHQNFEKIRQCFELIPALNLFKGKEVNSFMLNKLHAESVVTTHVRHCPNAFGVSIVTADGFKFTYSGDTMPCQGLIEIGQNSDLLIHEATMEDGMEDEAKLKTHSTTSQAIQVGQSMNAKFTLLTHFSQRYSKIPKFNDQFSAKTVGVAFDNMQITPNRLHYLPFFNPVLKQMFAESYEEMEAKTAKRNLRLLREENQKNKAEVTNV